MDTKLNDWKGRRVEDGNTTEDYDSGTVVDVREDPSDEDGPGIDILVAWDSGSRNWIGAGYVRCEGERNLRVIPDSEDDRKKVF